MPEPTLLALHSPGTIAPALAPDRGPAKARRLLERSASKQIDDETLEAAGWFVDPVPVRFGGTKAEERVLQPATGCRR